MLFGENKEILENIQICGKFSGLLLSFEAIKANGGKYFWAVKYYGNFIVTE